ncbi:MAG: hypothetical protein ACE5EF_12945, partial [Dehalococcoidia bacterium]
MHAQAEPSAVLFELVPSAADSESVVRTRDALAGINPQHPLAFEFAATPRGLRFFLRANSSETCASILGQLRSNYPQASLQPVSAGKRRYIDPLELGPHEVVEAVELVPLRDSALPIDTDPRHGEPFVGVLSAALASTAADIRVIG